MADHAAELAEQLEFMQGRLSEFREQMDSEPLYIDYYDSNGGKRRKANPAFDAYNALMRNYVRTLSEYRELTKGGAKTSPQLVKFENFAKTMKKVSAD